MWSSKACYGYLQEQVLRLGIVKQDKIPNSLGREPGQSSFGANLSFVSVPPLPY